MSRSIFFLGVLVLVGVGFSSFAAIDRNGNGMDDVWELIYNADSLKGNEDTDRDGFSNIEESKAGTNPTDPNSSPKLNIELQSSSLVRLGWDTLPGKRYTIESSTNLSGFWSSYWSYLNTDLDSQISFSPTNGMRFFRLVIEDVDSDEDHVTDYEEWVLGFDPTTSHSKRNDQPDLDRITDGLNTANVITIAALDPLMFERWPDPGLVAIRRSGGVGPLTVQFVLTGSATFGSDYISSATNTIFMPAGVREVWLELHPVTDEDNTEPSELITVTLQARQGYSIGPNNVANLTLANETVDSLPNVKSAARFLIQAAYGPDLAPANGVSPNVAEVATKGFEQWIDDQFSRPKGYLQPWVDWAADNADKLELYGNWKEFSWWARAMGSPKLRPDATSVTIPDPLRQRIAFALSEILVVSDRPEQLAVEQAGVANYYDLMINHAFGNYRDLLHDVALHPVMGIFLSHLGNQKQVPGSNIFPDENFAREIMQLFSIGLWQLRPDGSRMTDAKGEPIPTYDNRDITELARVFTGLSFGNNTTFNLYPRDFTVPMKCWDEFHDCNAKLLLGGLQLPQRTPSAGSTGTAGLADVSAAVSNLFVHPNVGPFIATRLIQRLITSNPSTGYVARVAAAFANNGSGIRGDMKAVVKAILLDREARDPAMMDRPTWGKLREPLLRVVNVAHAFNASSTSGHYALDQFTLDHVQDPMSAPSVFNFFLPTHSPPGPLTKAGLSAPEFQIINASSAVTGPNYFWNAILGDLHRWGHGNPDYTVRLNLSNELAMVVPENQTGQDVPIGPAADPDPLLRRLDLTLTGGTLSAPQFQFIREAMLRISTASWLWHRERLRLAIYLIVTSPDFNVLR